MKDNSINRLPSSPRISIRTYIRSEPSKMKNNLQVSSLLAYIFLTLCVIIIIYTLISYFIQHQQAQSKAQISNQITKQQNKQIIHIYTKHQMQQLYKSQEIPMGAVPIVNTIPTQCQKTRKQQLLQSLQNIKIFEILRSQLVASYPHQRQLNKYFIKIAPLYAVLHPKFTSAHISGDLSILSLNFWNPFVDSKAKEYHQINCIFNRSNLIKWESSGKYLTFYSDQPIKPAYFILQMPDLQNKYKLAYIYGISAYQEVLINRNTLQAVFIKKTQVKSGINQIECDQTACVRQYSMIMLVIQPMEILRIQVFQHKNRHYYSK